MISQLCPIDSLFQRLGRLHRHERERPIGSDAPEVTVLAPRHVDGDAPDYGLHQLIYGLPEAPNTRVLWRTEQLLRKNAVLDFPFCYRRMIEQVYDPEQWDDEPAQIDDAGYLLRVLNGSRKHTAQQRSRLTNDFPDSEAFGTALTRDGEMNLNVVPVILRAGQRYLLDEKNDTAIKDVGEGERDELLNMHTVPVPASWRNQLRAPHVEVEDATYFLPMAEYADGWHTTAGTLFQYTTTDGLSKECTAESPPFRNERDRKPRTGGER